MRSFCIFLISFPDCTSKELTQEEARCSEQKRRKAASQHVDHPENEHVRLRAQPLLCDVLGVHERIPRRSEDLASSRALFEPSKPNDFRRGCGGDPENEEKSTA